MTNTTIHVHRKISIYTSEGDPINIEEGVGMVLVKCDTNYYGKLDFTMEITTAKAMAEAILEQVKNIEEKYYDQL